MQKESLQMDKFLESKKILFMGPKFYNYHNEIVEELIENGAKVDFYGEKPETISYRFVSNYFKSMKSSFINKYLNNILDNLKEQYDYFFLIRGEIITIEFLEKLKLLNPNAKFIMYQWDSIKFTPNYPKIMNIFDKIMTFDMIDSKELNIEYLPLFYTNNYANIKLSKEKKYDISFFGSYHSDRLEIIKKLEKECKEKGLIFYHYLYSPKFGLFRKILNLSVKIEDLKYFKISPASNQEVLNIYKQSKSVLDIERDIQNGLTMRTLEVLGAGLKLITTNKNIVRSELYNEYNIFILERNCIDLDKSFFDSGITNNQIIKKYDLKSWLKKLFVKEKAF